MIRGDYMTPPAPKPQLELKRDGQHVMYGTENEIWTYLHRVSPCSVSHCLKHEGYSITPAG